MTKSLIVTLSLVLFCATASYAQVDNYALHLQGNGCVKSGSIAELEGEKSYTVQFWICPKTWAEGAEVFSIGDNMSAKLGTTGKVVFTVGTKTVTATSSALLKAGTWAQVTLVVTNGTAKAYVNNTQSGTGSLGALAEDAGDLVVGNGFDGRIDDLRLWKTALSGEFNFFWNNTLNQFNPNWDSLVAYYKFDQNLCDNVVDYKSAYTPTMNHHAALQGDAVREKVTDNTLLPYLQNGAYTANERFFDRAITREQYLLSNDIIMLGIQSYSDGHLKYCTPNNHGTLENCGRLDEFEGRTGVLSLNGSGRMSVGKDALLLNEDAGGKATGGYAFECWLYLDEWTEGAYLFRKESADGTLGLSIRLGADSTKEVFVYVDGRRYGHSGKLKVGQWMHFGIISRTATTASQIFGFVYDGAMSLGKKALCDATADNKPTNTTQFEAYIGEGIKGKMDDILIFNNRPYDSSTMQSDMAGKFKMPGLGIVQTSEVIQCYNSLWKFDKADNPGYDSYSQDEWKNIMESAYRGYRGYKIRISVKSHTDWLTTIADASKRKIFAADLARLSEPYEGVELDLEWAESSSQWSTVGLLADEIRAALPEGKTFMISTHAYTYQFPTAKMSKVDGFTFQQYGPQKAWFGYSQYTSTLASAKSYGYPADKIYASYSTTTSGPYNGSTQTGSAIIGVRQGLLDAEGFVPQGETDAGTYNGYTYYFTGPLQTYKRAKYCVDNNLQGIFYWDMGNDVKPEHKYCLARWCSYGLNANVDTLLTHVDLPWTTDIVSIKADNSLRDNATSAVYNIRGTRVMDSATKQEALEALPRGLYIIDGKKIIK